MQVPSILCCQRGGSSANRALGPRGTAQPFARAQLPQFFIGTGGRDVALRRTTRTTCLLTTSAEKQPKVLEAIPAGAAPFLHQPGLWQWRDNHQHWSCLGLTRRGFVAIPLLTHIPQSITPQGAARSCSGGEAWKGNPQVPQDGRGASHGPPNRCPPAHKSPSRGLI